MLTVTAKGDESGIYDTVGPVSGDAGDIYTVIDHVLKGITGGIHIFVGRRICAHGNVIEVGRLPR